MTPVFRSGNISLCVALFVIAFAIAGCSKMKNDNRTATGGSGQTNTSSPGASPANPPPAADAAGKPTTWEANATSLNLYRNDMNTFTLDCPRAARSIRFGAATSILEILQSARRPFIAD